MKFLNGFKTLIGALGLAVSVVLPNVAPGIVDTVGHSVFQVADGVFGALVALGVIHKAEKLNTWKEIK